MFAPEPHDIAVLDGNGTLAQGFPPDECSVFAAQVFDDWRGALQGKLGVPTRDVIYLMWVFIGVTCNGVFRSADQEREVRDDNGLQAEVVALGNQRQLRKRRIRCRY